MTRDSAVGTKGSLVSMLEGLVKRIPAVRGLRTRFNAEMSALLHAFRHGLWRHRRARTATDRKMQAPLVWESRLSLTASQPGLLAELQRRGVQYQEGGHTVYVPPQPDLAAKLGEFVTHYPADAGFKMLKDARGPAEARYIGDLRRHPWTQAALVGSPQDMVAVANLLYRLKIGPRLYDLVQLSAGACQLTAFVVQHLSGAAAAEAERQAFVDRLQALVEAGEVLLLLPDWRNHPDFRAPGCNGNLVKSDVDGELYYLDFQNFLVPDPDAEVRRLLHLAREKVHFGHSFIFRGGRYLYQQVPGVSETGKRDVRLRWERMRSMLGRHGLGVAGRTVLDVGCNTGMMLAEALNDGAAWGMGWDRPAVIEHGQKLLGALGYTRFQLVGTELSRNYPLGESIPDHLRASLPRAVIFYLAIRHHIGILDALASQPWEVLVYEGAEGEALDDLRAMPQQLGGPCELVELASVEDGDCSPRPLAIFRRLGGPQTSVNRPLRVEVPCAE